MKTIKKYSIVDRSKYQYFQLPKLLVYGEKYRKKLRAVDREAYAILLDRLNLSIKNNWVDEEGNIYFVFSNPQLMETLNVAKATLSNIKKTLIEAELLIEERTGRANRLYLLEPTPASEEEAKYILSLEHEEIMDTSILTEEDKVKISKGMVDVHRQKSQDNLVDVQKLNIDYKMASQNRLSDLSTDGVSSRCSESRNLMFSFWPLIRII